MEHPTEKRTVVLTVGTYHPHEVMFLLLAAVWGALYLLTAPPPNSVVAQLHPVVTAAWAATLLASGLIGLVALLPLPLERRLWLRMAAALGCAGALALAAVSIFTSAGGRGLFSGGFSVAWCVANVVQTILLYRDVRRLR